MSPPLMFQQALVRIDIAVLSRVRRSRDVTAVLRIAPIRVLRPKPMKDKRRMTAALRCSRMRIAKFRRPRQVQQVIVKVLGP